MFRQEYTENEYCPTPQTLQEIVFIKIGNKDDL